MLEYSLIMIPINQSLKAPPTIEMKQNVHLKDRIIFMALYYKVAIWYISNFSKVNTVFNNIQLNVMYLTIMCS